MLILSGFKPEHEARISRCLDEAGLQVVERRNMEDWIAVASKRKSGGVG